MSDAAQYIEELHSLMADAAVNTPTGKESTSYGCRWSDTEAFGAQWVFIHRTPRPFDPVAFEISSDDRAPTFKGPIAKFLDAVYEHQPDVSRSFCAQYIFTEVNDWITTGNLQVCNAMLSKADLDKVDSKTILSLLTIMRAARGHLPNWNSFVLKARDRITRLRGPLVADKLLRHMEVNSPE